ncbi:MAG: FliM/FliN family flagellar motor switch protein [Polyangiaceae bacterium]|nr:FliM/FliN family flagellar motor switch protein [Polyangiaceae bacterium]
MAAVVHGRRAVQAALEPEQLAATVQDLLGAKFELRVHSVQPAAAARDLPPVRVTMRLADGSAGWVVGLDSGLVTSAAALLLRRPIGIEAPHAPVGPALEGAAEALLLEIARRLSKPGCVATELGKLPLLCGAGAAIKGTARLSGRAYPVGAFLRWRHDPPRRPTRPELVERLGSLLLPVPLVVGECSATWRDLRALRPGDAWCFAGGSFIDRVGKGWGVLATPSATRGPTVTLAPDGKVVLLGETRTLALDVEEADVDDGTRDTDDSLTEVILDVPIVVRIELGVVSMPAREWSELRPGDVIRTDRRIGSPAVLRVAGREIATGELVEVDGDLAVRVLTFLSDRGRA